MITITCNIIPKPVNVSIMTVLNFEQKNSKSQKNISLDIIELEPSFFCIRSQTKFCNFNMLTYTIKC